METRDEKFMHMALEEAKQSLLKGAFPVGAVIVLGDEVIGRGRKVSSNYYFGHAEINALHEALRDKNYNNGEQLEIFTTLEPCVMCFGTILHSPIKRVVYALEDPYGGATTITIDALPVRHQDRFPQIAPGVLREDSRKLFKEFLTITESIFWKNSENPFVRIILA